MTVSAPGSLNKQKSRTHKIKSHPGQAKASTRKKLTRHKIEALSVTRDEYFELLSVTDTAIAAEAAGLTVDNFIAQQHQLCEEGQKKARIITITSLFVFMVNLTTISDLYTN